MASDSLPSRQGILYKQNKTKQNKKNNNSFSLKRQNIYLYMEEKDK